MSRAFPMTGHPLGPGGNGRPLLLFLYAHREYNRHSVPGMRSDTTRESRRNPMSAVFESEVGQSSSNTIYSLLGEPNNSDVCEFDVQRAHLEGGSYREASQRLMFNVVPIRWKRSAGVRVWGRAYKKEDTCCGSGPALSSPVAKTSYSTLDLFEISRSLTHLIPIVNA